MWEGECAKSACWYRSCHGAVAPFIWGRGGLLVETAGCEDATLYESDWIRACEGHGLSASER